MNRSVRGTFQGALMGSFDSQDLTVANVFPAILAVLPGPFLDCSRTVQLVMKTTKHKHGP